MDKDLTYEASRALQSTWGQPDKIYWEQEYAFRGSPYRLLHHQKGVIGTFRVQLLEARKLERSYWSALALGPVKHLGLSKAHGEISSFCTLALRVPTDPHSERKNSASNSKKYTSPVIVNQNSPVWNNCEWEIPLKKGIDDGMPIVFQVEATEDASAAESMGLPLIPSEHDRLLGTGTIDVTSLCLGEENGKSHIGVMDVWIKISKNNNETGEIHLLVSYTPNGLDPQQDDIVALESFARRNLKISTCDSLLPPLQPLKVLQTNGGFLLVEYRMRNQKRATLRLNRKAVFVIERQNIIDGAIKLAFLPADVILSTPVGQSAQSIAAPVLDTAGELLMPAFLSARLLWGAFRTTGFAAISGVFAATGSVWNNSRESHEQKQRHMSFQRPNISSL